MRRRPVLALPLVALCGLAVLPASAAPVAGEQVQSYSGAFVAPTRFTDTEAGFPGLGRRLFLVGEQADGVVADLFPVSRDAWGGAFELGDVEDATGAGDLDVYFYGDLGNIATQGVLPVTTAEYDTDARGEKGFVPEGTTYALVFSPDAVSPTFTFTAFDQPEVDLAELDGVELPAGATLRVVNGGNGYASLSEVADDEREPVLAEGFSGDGRGLRAGEAVSLTFPAEGSYVFEVDGGTATVTVGEGPGVGTPAG